MNLISEIKLQHIESFRQGNVKQATFLKTFKKEIFDLMAMDYKPMEIKEYLEGKLDVSINMNSFYSWLNYAKEKGRSIKKDESLNAAEKIQEEKGSIDLNTYSTAHSNDEQGRDEKQKSAMDILSSTDFD